MKSYVKASLETKVLLYVVSMDLQAYFDTINHSKLIKVLFRTVKDGLRELTVRGINGAIPNGTLHGVEGEGKISPIRS